MYRLRQESFCIAARFEVSILRRRAPCITYTPRFKVPFWHLEYEQKIILQIENAYISSTCQEESHMEGPRGHGIFGVIWAPAKVGLKQ